MKRISFMVTLAAAVLFGSAMANAGVIGFATPLAPAFTAPDTGLNAFAWESFQLTVQTDNGDLITAIDMFVAGSLHQRWADTTFDGVTNPSPNGPASNTRGDSHATPIVGALTGAASAEDNLVDGPLVDTFVPFVGGFDWGIGSFLSGALLRDSTSRVPWTVS